MTSCVVADNFGSAMYPKNWGCAAQVNYDNYKTGKIRKHDHVPFDKDSDIPEIKASVKSSNFTLASANVLAGETFDEQWSDYKKRVHSSLFVYVTKTGLAYEMTLKEFEEFVLLFCGFERESQKNGGGMKIRCRKETKKMLKWFEARA